MNQHEAFLADIREHPDDDTTRLVFADWLDDNGQADRAEFIRIQCRLETLPPEAPQRRALENRDTDLLTLHEEQWLGPPAPQLEEWTWRRGFVEEVTLTATASLAPVAGLFARHPVRRLNLTLYRCGLRDLTESPLLERLTGLEISAPLDGPDDVEDLRVVLESPRLAELTELGMWGDAAGDACLPLLAGRPGVEQLSILRLDDLTPAGARRLVAEKGLAGVSGLTLSPGEALGDAGLSALLVEPRRWTALEPMYVPFSATRLKRLTDCDRLERLVCSWPAGYDSALSLPLSLRHLHLNGISPLAGVARLKCLPNLWHLEFRLRSDNRTLDSAEFKALADLLTRLRGPVLELRVGGALSLDELLQLPGLDRLRGLHLHGQLTDRDFEALAGCTGLANLDTLILPDQPLMARQVSLLAEAPVLDGLRTLSLRRMGLAGKDIARIFRPGRLTRLRTLWLNDNGFGRAGVEAMLAWGGLPGMRELFFSENRIDAPTASLLLFPRGVSSLTRLGLSEHGTVEHRLTREAAQPFFERLGERFTFFEAQG
jgi:uncharacterized protein (TIGR02996 family)